MSQDQPEPGRSPVVVAVLALLLVPLLYVLSIGPAWWLVSDPTFSILYFPLIWVADHSVWFADALEWYVNLFGDDHKPSIPEVG